MRASEPVDDAIMFELVRVQKFPVKRRRAVAGNENDDEEPEGT